MNWNFFKNTENRADMLAIIAEQNMPQPVRDFLSAIVQARQEGPLSITCHGHQGQMAHLGDFFHMGEMKVQGVVFDKPMPQVPAPVPPSGMIVGDAQASAALAASADADGTGSQVEVAQAAQLAAPAPAAPAAPAAAPDPAGATPVAISEDPKDHA